MSYTASWNSLRNHPVPEWLQRGKFGIYTHWGVYSVPACRPNASWYPNNMYRRGTPQYEHHVKTYGGPEKFGYKDFIPMFTGERFDPAEWARLFKKAGARFAGPVGEHHDGFTMWDTQLTEWNSMRMGPRRDVTGELEKAIRDEGMKFMVALHHAENWFFYPHWEPTFDTSDPQYEGLYGRAHNLEWIGTGGPQGKFFMSQQYPDKKFLDDWLEKTKECIDRFNPDLLWFDFGLKYINEEWKKDFLSYYYNYAEARGQQVTATYKWHDFAVGSGVTDLELGRCNDLTYNVWLTDTTVDDGEGWGYLFDAAYKSPETLIHYLVDNVSKNGLLLLNVGPKPDGSIPKEAVRILEAIGAWLSVNGEAIYDTTPWVTYGEGPTKMEKTGAFTEGEGLRFTGEDIRYTVNGNALYATMLGWPESGEIVLTATSRFYETEVESIHLLGVDQPLRFVKTPEGLKITLPTLRPCDFAYALKIMRKRPF